MRLIPMVMLALAPALWGCGAGPKVKPDRRPDPAAAGQPLRLTLALGRARGGAPAAPALVALRHEARRYLERFRTLPEPRPYFLAHQITDRQRAVVAATTGALQRSYESRERTLDVELRVGDYRLDNTHPLQGGDRRGRWTGGGTWTLPLDDDPGLLRPTIWIATERQLRQAVERYLQVKGNKAIKAEAEDRSDDFSREPVVRHLEAPGGLAADRAAWEKRVRALSALFAPHPEVLRSHVRLEVTVVDRYLATSEGREVQTSRRSVRLSIMASARTEDGMDLGRQEQLDASSLERLPGDAEIRRRIARVIADLKALRRAPLVDPFVGPAILEGKAAGVFFHEIFGHRIEGHRQKRDEEGQTFARKVGKRVMPELISIYDDPTIRTLNGVELNGHYLFDDEGVPARRASLVERGILKGFLMSRSPTRGFTRSNGHGRRSEGYPVAARQANLVVHPGRVVPPAELKRLLLAEVKRQGKLYGLRFTVVTGGFTLTGRQAVQSFKVMPVMVYRVYPDGREELVRGANIEGTPLTSLSQILAAADDVAVFNGYCGAESGMIPVSAASPSLLVARVEIARKSSSRDKPPLLPPPGGQGKGGTP